MKPESLSLVKDVLRSSHYIYFGFDVCKPLASKWLFSNGIIKPSVSAFSELLSDESLLENDLRSE